MIEFRDPKTDPMGLGTNKINPHLKGRLPVFPLRLHFIANLPLAALFTHPHNVDEAERLAYLDSEVAKAFAAVHKATNVLVSQCLSKRISK